MNTLPKVRDVLEGHITLELDSIDRLYLNGYVPQLHGNPAAHQLPGHADLPSDTRTTHHDRGIFREQRQQRGDSPVGYTRKSWLWLMLGHVKRSSVIPIGSNRECADRGICRRALTI